MTISREHRPVTTQLVDNDRSQLKRHLKRVCTVAILVSVISASIFFKGLAIASESTIHETTSINMITIGGAFYAAGILTVAITACIAEERGII